MATTKDNNINQAVHYDQFGDTDVLYIADLPKEHPEAGQVLVKIKTAGINPGEASIRKGLMAEQFPSKFPSGQGSDFAGVIESLGDGVGNFKIGDEVLGFSNKRNAQAEYVIASMKHLVLRPENVSWEIAGSLFVAGATAYAAVRAVALTKDDIVIISGAAGGVGSIAVQLAKQTGAVVLGIASASNHQWLSDHGIIPVPYHGDLAANLKAALGDKKANAFIDLSGHEYVELAIKLGIGADRINTIINFEAAAKYKTKTEGMSAAANATVLGELAAKVNAGDLEVPIAKTFPLSEVKEAYLELEQRHTHGKIVLIVA